MTTTDPRSHFVEMLSLLSEPQRRHMLSVEDDQEIADLHAVAMADVQSGVAASLRWEMARRNDQGPANLRAFNAILNAYGS